MCYIRGVRTYDPVKAKIYRGVRKDERSAYMKEWRAERPGEQAKYWAKLKERDPEYGKRASRKWYAANRETAITKQASMRAKRRSAMPQWVDEKDIEFVYSMARLFGMSVDHIIPLCGKNVCGLHVPWNLQLMPLEDNKRKSNKFDPTSCGV